MTQQPSEAGGTDTGPAPAHPWRYPRRRRENWPRFPRWVADKFWTRPPDQPRWRERWWGWARWLADWYWFPPPEPPDDAEFPEKRPRRESWPVLFRGLADRLHPRPWNPPERFPQSEEVLRERLATYSDRLADELLADAERLFDEAETRVTGVESRATTLQGTVAIAATVALAGGALVLDPSKIHGGNWRLAFAIGLALLVLMLVATAYNATQASGRVFGFTTPSDDDIFVRAKQRPAAAKTRRAAYLLKGYGRNNEAAAIKVGYLRSAAWWFRWALLMLLVLMGMVCAYVWHRNDVSSATKPAYHTTQGKASRTVHPPKKVVRLLPRNNQLRP